MEKRLIGLLVPATNYATEHEFHEVKQPGLFVVSERIWNTYEQTGTTIESTRKMNDDVKRAARYVAARPGVQVIAYACTAGSFYEGPDTDKDASRDIQETTGIPAITTTTCVVQALHLLNVRRLSVATPYGELRNQMLKVFFESVGFEVLNVETPGEVGYRNALVGEEPKPLIEAVASVAHPDADAVFVSSTGVRAMHLLDELESRISRPVVTSNQATIWGTLPYVGVTAPVEGFGQLLRNIDKVAT